MNKTQIRRNIKKNAKTMLRGSFWTAFFVFALYLIVSFGISALGASVLKTFGIDIYGMQNGELPSYVAQTYDWKTWGASFGLMLVSMLITMPLLFGVTEWFVRLSEGKKQPAALIFDWFSTGKSYLKSIGLSLNVFFRTCVFLLLPLGIISFGVTLLSVLYQNAIGPLRMTDQLLFLAGLLVGIMGMLLLEIFIMRYSLSTYLCVHYPAAKDRALIKESVVLMKGHKAELFVFVLSFFPWFLLIPLTFGLILIWLAPYLFSAFIIFCNYVYDVNKNAGRGNPDFPPYRSAAGQSTVPEGPFGQLFRPSDRADNALGETKYATAEFDFTPPPEKGILFSPPDDESENKDR